MEATQRGLAPYPSAHENELQACSAPYARATHVHGQVCYHTPLHTCLKRTFDDARRVFSQTIM